MRFLANENFPLESVKRLRAAGHEVAAIIEDSPGEKDRNVLARAENEQCIILTFDRDYGELIYKMKHAIPAGVVYLRFIPYTPREPAEIVLNLLRIEGLDLQGKFTVAGRTQIRQRPLLRTAH